MQISFVGANDRAEPQGESRSALKTCYYIGTSNDWHVDEHFERVRYPEIYSGIDLVLRFPATSEFTARKSQSNSGPTIARQRS